MIRRCSCLLLLACVGLLGCQASLGPERDPGTGNPLEPRPLLPEITVVRPPMVDVQAEVRDRTLRLQREPDSVRAHLDYAATLTRLGLRAQARAHYEERAAQPDARTVEKVMAARLGSSGASSALRRVYAAAADSQPNNPWWPLGMTEVELAEAQAWNARRLAAIDRADRQQEALAYEQAKAATVRAARALARVGETPASPPEYWLYLGHLRAMEGDLARQPAQREAAFQASKAAFERAVAQDPTLVDAWEGLGDVRYRLGDVGGSLQALLSAAQRAPGDGRLREAVGVALHELGREEDAAVQYAAAALLQPHDIRPLIRLGDALAAQELWEEALRAWDRAIERNAEEAVEAYARQAAVYEHLGRREEARQAYERYIDGGGERPAFAQRRIDRILRGAPR